MAQYDRLRNTATRLITKFGEKIRYKNVLDGEPTDGKDWERGAPQINEYSVSVVFLPMKSSIEQLFRMMQNGNVQTGSERAYMHFVNFTPSLKDLIIRNDGVERRIRSISPIKPNGDSVVVYELELEE
ncbi:TPA: hypothetical protein NNQ18_004707 [Salmonella enterica]|nr:hypothetical protein [Salmonella enterica]HCH8414886.1 hypothetical protein [Salmonella enterica]HCH8780814.1 hypothetical protein [Salmonella enterica]